MHAYVGVYRNSTTRGGAYFVEPASSTVGDGFEVRFDSASSEIIHGSADLATAYTINGTRTAGVTAKMLSYKLTITKKADIRVRIRRKNGS